MAGLTLPGGRVLNGGPAPSLGDRVAGDWTSYTPDIIAYAGPNTPGTNPTMGNTVVDADENAYLEIGSLVIVKFRFEIGDTFAAGSGFYFVEAPVQPAWYPQSAGTGEAIQRSTFGATHGFAVKVDPAWETDPTPLLGPMMMTNETNFDGVKSDAPFAWAATDILVGWAVFEKAP